MNFTRNEDIISGRLHDELVMMDIEKGKYFALNSVATRIWDLLSEPLPVEKLCARLLEEYNVPPDQCLQEVSEYLEHMVKLGLILKSEEQRA